MAGQLDTQVCCSATVCRQGGGPSAAVQQHIAALDHVDQALISQRNFVNECVSSGLLGCVRVDFRIVDLSKPSGGRSRSKSGGSGRGREAEVVAEEAKKVETSKSFFFFVCLVSLSIF